VCICTRVYMCVHVSVCVCVCVCACVRVCPLVLGCIEEGRGQVQESASSFSHVAHTGDVRLLPTKPSCWFSFIFFNRVSCVPD